MLGSGFHGLLITAVLHGDGRLKHIASTFIKWFHLVQSRQQPAWFMGFLASGWIAKNTVEKDENIIVDKHIALNKILGDEAGRDN